MLQAPVVFNFSDSDKQSRPQVPPIAHIGIGDGNHLRNLQHGVAPWQELLSSQYNQDVLAKLSVQFMRVGLQQYPFHHTIPQNHPFCLQTESPLV